MSKEKYINNGFIEVTIGVVHVRMQQVGKNLHAQRKQYGLKHCVTGTIDWAMGDRLPKVAVEISAWNNLFKIWDKGQLVVVLSRTKFAKDTIFVGDKEDTLLAIRQLLTCQVQWSDYSEKDM
eukprot:15316351-Ditylum_brightwellii.AAC.1